MTGVNPLVLSQLAAHDREVENIRLAIRSADKRSADLDALASEYRAEAAAAKARNDELKLQIRQAELELADLRRQSKVHQGHLNEISDSREYRALNEEIRYIQRQIGDKEETTLVAMEEAEKAQARLEETTQAYEEKQVEVDTQKAELEAERLDFERRLTGRQKAREIFVREMPAGTLHFYERRASRMVMPVVWLWEDHACGFCHHRLTPQARLEVRNSKRLVSCESCGRIIVMTAPVAPLSESRREETSSAHSQSETASHAAVGGENEGAPAPEDA